METEGSFIRNHYIRKYASVGGLTLVLLLITTGCSAHAAVTAGTSHTSGSNPAQTSAVQSSSGSPAATGSSSKTSGSKSKDTASVSTNKGSSESVTAQGVSPDITHTQQVKAQKAVNQMANLVNQLQ